MDVLVVNTGSSSLKYQFINVEARQVLAKGACERIGSDAGVFTNTCLGEKTQVTLPLPDHRSAITQVLDTLCGCEALMAEHTIDAIGHRVVHGAQTFVKSCVVDDAVIAKLQEVSALAPLHNPPAINAIMACREAMPDVVNIACFDTAFHATIPEVAWRYALPYDLCDELGLRKYGFHGTNHRWISVVADQLCDHRAGRLISCHLGNGSSLCAIKDGVAQETTMGFTPLDGLVMGTRCGSIDPAVVTYILENTSLSARELDNIMNKQSGVLAISGFTNDMRDIEAAASEGNARARLALDMFHYSVRKHFGAMWGALGGVDTVAFTGGVGENSASTRAAVLEPFADQGIILDKELNAQRSKDARIISAPQSRVRVIVVPADEEYMIALDVKSLLS